MTGQPPPAAGASPRAGFPGRCGPGRDTVAPRWLAGALLGVLGGRLLASAGRGSFGSPAALVCSFAVLGLGGCLWWVAHRQVGAGGALVALGLYAFTPALAAGVAPAAPGALGIFAMVYTGVGVAHALAGPRRKWRPRIALMCAICFFTGAVQPWACVLGLLLALLAMLYLLERGRRLLPVLFGVWAFAAALGCLLARAVPADFSRATPVSGFRFGPVFGPVFGPMFGLRFGPVFGPVFESSAGLVLGCAAALALYAASRRSRYFGNTAPLAAALLLGGSAFLAGPQAVVWLLPFALLFVAGVFADGLEGRSRGVWVGLAVLACGAQCALACLQ